MGALHRKQNRILGIRYGALTINGGTTTLSGINTYTGSSNVTGGGLTLDFSAATTPATATNIISVCPRLSWAAARACRLHHHWWRHGSSNSQTFVGTTFNSNGSSAIVVTQNNATSVSLALGTLTRNAAAQSTSHCPAQGTVSTASTTLGEQQRPGERGPNGSHLPRSAERIGPQAQAERFPPWAATRPAMSAPATLM